MDRRTFLKTVIAAGAVASTGVRPGFVGAQVPPHADPILLNIILRGGPDFRHLIAPPFGTDTGTYSGAYWNNRWRSHNLSSDPESWQRRWNDDFLSVAGASTPFGIWSGAAWLKAQYDAGNVAIISNVLGTDDRNHIHGEMIYDSGDRRTGTNDLTRDGWGGRLAVALDANVVSMTNAVRPFCYGPHATDPSQHDNTRVISARDTRNIALYEDPELIDNPSAGGARQSLSRGLESYYAAVGETIAEDSPYADIVQHERTIRAFGDRVNARLSTTPIPAAIEALYDGDGPLGSRHFGRQIRNVHDALACADIFNFRVGSLMLDGFDTHRDQAGRIEANFSDLFGETGGLATLYGALEETMPDARSNLITVLGGEFGRQLVANGDQGTDHGRGLTVLVIGDRVRGGLYGDLFPESEIERYQSESSADVDGLTAIEQVFAAVCEGMMPGTGSVVIPGAEEMELELGVDLTTLFSG